MTARKPYAINWAWVILGVCFFDLFISYSARLGYGVILPEMIGTTLGFRDLFINLSDRLAAGVTLPQLIAGQLNINRTDAGSIYNAYLLTYVLVTPLTGYLTDRLGARRVISACALIMGVGLVLMGAVTGLGTACLFFAIVGLGATGMWTSVITVVQRWFAPNRRGLALGFLSVGYGLGFATTGVVFPLIFMGLGWRWAWYLLGAGALVMFVVNAVLLRSDPYQSGRVPWGGERPEAAVDPATPSVQSAGTWGVFRHEALTDKTYWLIGFSYFAVAFGLYGLTTFMVDFAKNQLGLDPAVAGFLATVHGVCQVAGVLTILPLSDRWGRRRTILFSNLCLTVLLTGVVVLGRIPALLFVLVGLTAFFYGATFPIYGACAGDYFPRGVMGTVIGSWTVFYGLGAVISNWVSGILRDLTGVYDWAFAVNAIMVAVALGLMALIKKDAAT
jgi:MFS family permease